MNIDSLDYIPHRNLTTLSRLDNTAYTSDYLAYVDSENELKNKQIKFQKQKQKIKGLNRQLQMASTQADIAEIKESIFEEFTTVANQLSQLTEQNQCLLSENEDLKISLNKKNELIEQFQNVINESTGKIKTMQILIENLKQELKNKEDVETMNDKMKEDNLLLSQNLKDIKEQINEIEQAYSDTMASKENEINQLKQQLKIEKEEKEEIIKNKEQSTKNIIEDNEKLQAQVNCLLKEKEILLKEKIMDHQEIMTHRQMVVSSDSIDIGKTTCENGIGFSVRQLRKREEEMVNLFKTKEESYMSEISKLHHIIVEREEEIEKVKEQLFGVIHGLKLDNERLQRYLLDNVVKKPEFKKENDYLY